MIKLSRGNMKLHDTLIWNLPAVTTCPFATDSCKQFCYARKAEKMYPSVLPSRERHFEASLESDFVDQMIATIEKENALKLKRDGVPYKFFRIHESGDFYNQKYVDAWYRIASAFPSIKFLAFTKSYSFNYESLKSLPNVNIRYSFDGSTKAIRIDLPLAMVRDGHTETRSTKTFSCNVGMKCHECRICWNSNIDVAFELH